MTNLPTPPGGFTYFVPSESPVQKFRRDLFTATPKVWVSPLLVAANVMVFVLMVANGVGFWEPSDNDKMIAWGAGYGPLTTHGQPWRLFTELFIHFGVIHLLGNMIVLWQAGPLVERLFGNISFLVLYLLSGLCGSLASVVAHPYSVAGGASGAIFGVFGALFGFLFIERGIVPKPMLKSLTYYAAIFVGFNVLGGATQKGIDMAAHGGGLFGGFFLGVLLSRKLVPNGGTVRAIIVAIVGGAASFGASRYLPPATDLDDQWQRMSVILNDDVTLFNKSSEQWNDKQITDDQFASILDDKILAPLVPTVDHFQSLKGVDPQLKTLWDQELHYTTLRRDQWAAVSQYLHSHNPDDMDHANQLNSQADELAKSL
jgi:rhomboid protease GluP